MSTDEMKKCPYCAEWIKAEAVKCRYCGSMLKSSSGGSLGTPNGYWHRVNEGKKIAGVVTGIAHQFDAPVLIMPLRVFFVISTLFYFFGPIVYVLLWLLMPAPTDEDPARTTQRPSGYNGTAVPPQAGMSPPVVNSYPGASPTAPSPPPAQAAAPADAKENVAEDQKNGQDEADGTIGLETETEQREKNTGG